MQTIIIAVIGSGALSAFISGVFLLINNHQKAKTGIEKGVQLLLLGELKRSGNEYIRDKEISTEDLEAFNETYNTYKQLNGNGFADTLIAKVRALPLEVG